MRPENTLNPRLERRAEQLFEQALALEAEQRHQFVGESTVGDSELAQLVLDLLKHHEQPQGVDSDFILDHPIGVSGSLTNHGPETAVISEHEGDTIDRYKLLERIGEGGMGVVYMAEQTTDVRRRVAIKIIKLGLDTRNVVARFGVERQAMAMFDHPGIARLLDAGTTETGRPYYVMELVKGRDAISFSQRHDLSITDRLKLFIKICSAVQHSHQKGIIHRDIKPSNILVAMVDGKPEPKIIDFGIAKALHHRLVDQTLFTRYSTMIGTPQYMSPEQAESSGVDVDTRSDIYGLGVLLYELMTGTTPLCKKKLAELNPIALIETLRSQDFEPPSTRISKIGTDSAETMHLEAVQYKLQRELDWIVMKALAHDRKMRYQSASELAADVQRFLDGDPVVAAEPSRYYKLQSHIRKHKMRYSFGAILSALVIASTVFCFVFAIKSHFANIEKNYALEKLSQKNSLLLEAQEEIKRQNLEKRLRRVVGMAHMRFSNIEMRDIFQRIHLGDKLIEIREEANREYPEKLPSERHLPQPSIQVFADASDIIKIPGVRLPELLDSLELQGIVASDLESIVAVFVSDQNFIDRMEVGFEGFATADEETSESPIRIYHEHENVVTDLAPEEIDAKLEMFFRILTDEYRQEFGESDPHVASSLNLLAAALIQNKKYHEAKATLRAAIATTNSPESTSVSRSLLEKCNELENLGR